jgi:histidyl-tRNA synthetase
VVVEDDTLLADAIASIGKLRAAGFAAEMLATGSVRKRFDKASRMGAKSLVSFVSAESVRVRGERQGEIEALLA